ncbi:aldo/keto reductase [Xanthobacter autotrophicus]|uniref:aldo/keto reductase n=1 Tax=Xanthobacter autotrophicus TaxID=280 RepID=UPI003729D4ED
MKYRYFGRGTGIKASPLILGCGMLGNVSGYGSPPDEAKAILTDFVVAGGNFIDTSDAYQFGQSETLIGEFISSCRDDYIISSKYSRTASQKPSVAAQGSHRKAMVQSVEASLRRLNTDRIDIYLAHMDDGATPIEEVVRGFEDLVSAGKIIFGGFSNTPAWRVAKAATVADMRGWAPLGAVQLEYSLLQRTPERELLPMADEFGLAVMGYSPLAGGVLTGKYRKGEEGRATAFKGAISHNDAGLSAKVIDILVEASEQLGASPGQIAIAWAISKGVFPIIGPRSAAQLEDNLGAASISLDNETIKRLDAASEIALGYPHELLASIRQP